MHRSFLAIGLALFCGGVGLATPFGRQQTFRSAVHTVEIYATVVDGAGRLVPDLTKDDFEIQDEGKTQPITVFEAGTQRITIAIMLDESPSVFRVALRIANAIQAFAEQLGPEDRAALGAFAHYIRFDPTLTSDKAILLHRLDAPAPEFPAGTALWDAILEAAKALDGQSGRRVVLVLSDGKDNCSLAASEDVRARLEADGVMMYAIGIKGQSGIDNGELADVVRRTGGYHFELRPQDDLGATFRRVADELHRQYLLGFTVAVLDGRVHHLTVKSRRGGLKVRARTVYVAPKAQPSPGKLAAGGETR